MVRRQTSLLVIRFILFVSVLGMLGTGPNQGVPPQPYFEDFFSGNVTVQGESALLGIELVACIDDCQKVFESQPVRMEEGGRYRMLEVFPEDQGLAGHTITFYLANEFGRIRAAETAIFEAAPNRPPPRPSRGYLSTTESLPHDSS